MLVGILPPGIHFSTVRPVAPAVMVSRVRGDKPPTHNACCRDRLSENLEAKIGKSLTYCVEAGLAECSGDRTVRPPTHNTCVGEAGLADCLSNGLGKPVWQDSKLGNRNIRYDRETIGSEANNLSINNLVTPIDTMENSNRLVPRR